MAAATKKKRKEEAHSGKAGACSGHTTNLKQSILETFDIYVYQSFLKIFIFGNSLKDGQNKKQINKPLGCFIT
jgi:hypothetical protein